MEAPNCYPGSKDELSTYYVPGSILSAEAMTKDNTDGVQLSWRGYLPWLSSLLPQFLPTFTLGSNCGHVV